MISKVEGVGVNAGRFNINEPEDSDAVDMAVDAPIPTLGDLLP